MNTAPESSILNLEAFANQSEDPAAGELAALTVFDRCDAPECAAQAYVRVQLASGLQLVFCGHHGHDLAPTLIGKGAVIRDDSHVLDATRRGSTYL